MRVQSLHGLEDRVALTHVLAVVATKIEQLNQRTDLRAEARHPVARCVAVELKSIRRAHGEHAVRRLRRDHRRNGDRWRASDVAAELDSVPPPQLRRTTGPHARHVEEPRARLILGRPRAGNQASGALRPTARKSPRRRSTRSRMSRSKRSRTSRSCAASFDCTTSCTSRRSAVDFAGVKRTWTADVRCVSTRVRGFGPLDRLRPARPMPRRMTTVAAVAPIATEISATMTWLIWRVQSICGARRRSGLRSQRGSDATRPVLS